MFYIDIGYLIVQAQFCIYITFAIILMLIFQDTNHLITVNCIL